VPSSYIVPRAVFAGLTESLRLALPMNRLCYVLCSASPCLCSARAVPFRIHLCAVPQYLDISAKSMVKRYSPLEEDKKKAKVCRRLFCGVVGRRPRRAGHAT
jgi:hypothetical protein